LVVQQATETEESRQAVDGESCRRVAAAIPGPQAEVSTR